MKSEILYAELRKAGCDVDGAIRRMMGDEALYLRLLTSFYRERTWENLHISLEQGDAAAAFQVAHLIKGSTATLGLTPVYDAISRIVESLRPDDSLPEPAQKEFIQTEDFQSESVRSGIIQTNLFQLEPARLELIQIKDFQSEPSQPELFYPETFPNTAFPSFIEISDFYHQISLFTALFETFLT